MGLRAVSLGLRATAPSRFVAPRQLPSAAVKERIEISTEDRPDETGPDFGFSQSVDRSPFLIVGRSTNHSEAAARLQQILEWSPSKMVVLWLISISERFKLLDMLLVLGLKTRKPYFGQILPRLKDGRMRFRVIRDLPLRLPKRDRGVPVMRVSGATDPGQLMTAMSKCFNESSSGFVKLAALGPGAKGVAVFALERLQQMRWNEISIAARPATAPARPGLRRTKGMEVWVHLASKANPVPPEQAWTLFHTVSDAGQTAQDLAKRAAEILQAHSVQFVDLTSSNASKIVEALAALPSQLSAASLIGPRTGTNSICARITKGFPQRSRPTAMLRTASSTQVTKLADSLLFALRDKTVVQVQAMGPAAMNHVLAAIERVKWTRNKEVAFTVASEPVESSNTDGTGIAKEKYTITVSYI